MTLAVHVHVVVVASQRGGLVPRRGQCSLTSMSSQRVFRIGKDVLIGEGFRIGERLPSVRTTSGCSQIPGPIRAPQVPFVFVDVLEKSKTYFDVFGCFSKLITFSVTAVASS